MKIYDLEGNTILDIVMKPHRKNLDLKFNDEYLFVADQTSKSVIVSSVKESLWNYDKSVKIGKTVSSVGTNPFKRSFYQKSSSENEFSYAGSNQGTGNFGKKLSRQRSVNKHKNSILSNNGMNLMNQNSYSGNVEKDPYTGKRYDFTDFDDALPSKDISSHVKIGSQHPASPPTINSFQSQEIISKLTNNHSKVVQLYKNRKSQLWSLQQMWSSGNSLKTLKYLYQSSDTSLIKDFWHYTFEKNEGYEFLTIEACAIVLRLIKLLIAKPHTEFQEWAKASYQNLLNHVKPVSLFLNPQFE